MAEYRGILYLVVPCYNEEAVLPQTNSVLTELLGSLAADGKISSLSRIMYVDDGSKDSTWSIISKLSEDITSPVCGLKLSRNRGHQNALLAGLTYSKDLCDMAVSLDADLQDDPEVIRSFIDEYYSGCDIVYGVRCDRSSDSTAKRLTAQGYYKFLSLLGVEIIYNHADYRLMSKRALEALCSFDEVNLFLRGIVPQLGFKTATVEYSRNPRLAGESKYTLKKMLTLAIDGITSFSVRPLRLITAFSCFVLLASVIGWIACLATKMTIDKAILLSVWSACGFTLLGVSVVGEYVGRSYLEIKHRPKFIISQFIKK